MDTIIKTGKGPMERWPPDIMAPRVKWGRKWMGKSKKGHKKHPKGTFNFLKKEGKMAKSAGFLQIVK